MNAHERRGLSSTEIFRRDEAGSKNVSGICAQSILDTKSARYGTERTEVVDYNIANYTVLPANSTTSWKYLLKPS